MARICDTMTYLRNDMKFKFFFTCINILKKYNGKTL